MSSNKSYDRPLEHKEYLKMKYLSGTVEQQNEKQRKKSLFKSVTKHKKIRIVDDDIDLKSLRANGSDDELYFGTKEEKPMIAQVIDDRPAYLRRRDIDTNQWKTVGTIDDDFDGTNNRNSIDVKSKQSRNREQTKTMGKSRNDDEDSDLSPPRYSGNNNRQHKHKSLRVSDNSDSDLSPPRMTRRDVKTNANNSDSDLSPPRITDSNIVNSVKRSSKYLKTHSSDSDLSPVRVDRRHNSRADTHHNTHRSNKDLSLKVKTEKSDSRSSKMRDNDKDLSPPRNRHSLRDYKREMYSMREKNESKYSDNYGDKEKRLKSEKNSDQSYKMERTLSGKKSGLSNAKELQKEILSVKEKEKKLFSTISDDVLGKNAKTVFRDSKTGKIRNLEEEAQQKLIEDNAKAKIDAEKIEKYKKWSKGLVQDQEQKERAESALHEMSKPLARYEDDSDLDKMLREREREDDPMLAMMRQKKAKTDLKEGKADSMPTYNGPTPPPVNRFKILPGYRWDGVNRSNGFEQKHFERTTNREANIEEAYRWSVQDM